MIDDAEIKRLRALCEAATPGLDSPSAAPGWCWERLADNVFEVQRCNGWSVLLKRAEDAHFIAASRSAMPKLLDAIEELREPGGMTPGKEAEELRSGIEQIMDDPPGGDDESNREWIGPLRELLDKVDARDSLAYLKLRDANYEIDGRRSESELLRAALIEALELAAEANGDPSSCSYSVPIGNRVRELQKLFQP